MYKENEELVRDMQSLPAVGKNIEKYEYEIVRPTTRLETEERKEDTPIEFIIEGRNDSWVDVKVSQLYHYSRQVCEIIHFLSEHYQSC